MPEPTQKKRRSRHQREQHPTPMQITERVLDILEFLYTHRAATTEHIAQLVFERSPNSYLGDQLATLFHHGFITRRFLLSPYGIAPSKIVHLLDRPGLHLLERTRGVKMKWLTGQSAIKQDFLSHSLAINDVELAVRRSAHAEAYTLSTWLGESAIHADYDSVTVQHPSGTQERRAVLPDSHFVITPPQGSLYKPVNFFLELDRGTESGKRFADKIRAYIAYIGSSACKTRFGAPRIRVLTITEGKRRLPNLKSITEKTGGKTRFWFATLDECKQHNVLTDPIWQIAGTTGMTSLLNTSKEDSQEKGATVLATPFISTLRQSLASC